MSGLAGIFIKCIYAGCGKIQRLYFSTPVYREFAKPVPTPTTRQAVARGRLVLHYRSVSFVRGVWMPWIDLIRSKSVVSERKSRGAAHPASAGRRQAVGGTRQGCGRGMSDPSGALFNFLKRVCAHRRQSAQLLYGEGTAVRQYLVAPRFQHLS